MRRFGDPLEQVGGRFLTVKADFEAWAFAGRQLEMGIAERTFRAGGWRRPDVAQALGITRGQLDHVLSGRRGLSLSRQVQFGRALMSWSYEEVRRTLAQENRSSRWEDDDTDDAADAPDLDDVELAALAAFLDDESEGDR